MSAVYNEIDAAAAQILRYQIDNGVIAPGVVMTKSIKDIDPDELKGFTQVHLFAGGGLWSVAARIAGWPDDEPIWTGSCPCQPFSAAGKGGGTDDPRHLWPDFHRLIRARRPPIVMGEQVAGKAGYGWFDGVRADLARESFAGRTVDFPACSVDAPHQRNRLYWVAGNMEYAPRIGWGEGRAEHDLRGGWPTPAGANASGVTLGDAFGARLEGQRGNGDSDRGSNPGGSVAEADGPKRIFPSNAAFPVVQGQPSTRNEPDAGKDEGLYADTRSIGRSERGVFDGGHDGPIAVAAHENGRNGTYWSDSEWIDCHDGKARRAKSDIRFLVNGLPGRVDLWRVGGNAILPEVAAEVIGAVIDVYGLPSDWRVAE